MEVDANVAISSNHALRTFKNSNGLIRTSSGDIGIFLIVSFIIFQRKNEPDDRSSASRNWSGHINLSKNRTESLLGFYGLL